MVEPRGRGGILQAAPNGERRRAKQLRGSGRGRGASGCDQNPTHHCSARRAGAQLPRCHARGRPGAAVFRWGWPASPREHPGPHPFPLVPNLRSLTFALSPFPCLTPRPKGAGRGQPATVLPAASAPCPQLQVISSMLVIELLHSEFSIPVFKYFSLFKLIRLPITHTLDVWGFLDF